MLFDAARGAQRKSVRASVRATKVMRSSLLKSDKSSTGANIGNSLNKSATSTTSLRSKNTLGRLLSLLRAGAEGDDAERPKPGGWWGPCCGGAADVVEVAGGRAEAEAPEAQKV